MAALNLSVSAYGVNADVNSRLFCDADAVADKKWKSDLQAMFAKRLGEEMDERKLSGNDLARIAQKSGRRLGQPTISRILNGKQDPGLEKIDAIADALGLPAWYLMTDAAHVEQRVIRTPPAPNVVKLASPYQRILLGHAKTKTKKQRRG